MNTNGLDLRDYAIYAEHLVFEYGIGTPFRKKALDDVTFGVKKGRITGIIGHTGSGKSTLVQMMNGILKPQSGKVYFDGEDIHRDKKLLPKLRYRIGLVFQYPEYQLFEETVRRDIAYGPTNMGLSEEEVASRVTEAAAFVGLDEEFLDKSPFDLSGGQKRRVALAGVIAMRPEVLVLDEPAAGLDPRGRDFIFEGICEYQKATGSTVLIVSHSMEDMARYCDEMIVMAQSRLMMSGDCETVFARIGELSDIGLDIPQITRLMQMLRERGIDVPENIYTVEAAIDAIKRLFEGGEVRA